MLDSQEGDREFLDNYEEQVKMLAGLVIEAVEENPQYLLSPILRKVMIDKAKEVQRIRSKFAGEEIYVDNCGTPLKDR